MSEQITANTINNKIQEMIDDFIRLAPDLKDKLGTLQLTQYFLNNNIETIPNDLKEGVLSNIDSLITQCFKRKTLLHDRKQEIEWLQNKYSTASNSQQPLQELQAIHSKYNNFTLPSQNDAAKIAECFHEQFGKQIKKVQQFFVSTVQERIEEYTKGLYPSFLVLLVPKIKEIDHISTSIQKDKSSAQEILQSIKEMQEKIEEKYKFIKDGIIHGVYATQANKDNVAANWWTLGGISLMIGSIAWLLYVCYEINLDAVIFDKYTFFLHVFPRGSITLCVLGLAKYCFNRANHFKRNASLLKNKEFIMFTVFDVLKNTTASTTQEEIRNKLTEHVLKDFSQSTQ